MDALIGVKDLRTAPLAAAEALLFDRIALPDWEGQEAHLKDPAKAADLQWLRDQGIFFDQPVDGLRGGLEEKLLFRLKVQARMASGFLSIVDGGVGKKTEKKAKKLLDKKDQGDEDFSALAGDYIAQSMETHVRFFAAFLQAGEAPAAVALLPQPPTAAFLRQRLNENKLFDLMMETLGGHPDGKEKDWKKVSKFGAAIQRDLLNHDQLPETAEEGEKNPLRLKMRPAVRILLEEFPMPPADADRTLLAELRAKEEVGKARAALRAWMAALGSEGASLETADVRLGEAVEGFQREIEAAGLPVTAGTLEMTGLLPEWRLTEIQAFAFTALQIQAEERKIPVMAAEKAAPGAWLAVAVR